MQFKDILSLKIELVTQKRGRGKEKRWFDKSEDKLDESIQLVFANNFGLRNKWIFVLFPMKSESSTSLLRVVR